MTVSLDSGAVASFSFDNPASPHRGASSKVLSA
jgi:hypothetical protein